jgi:hypothetical protein
MSLCMNHAHRHQEWGLPYSTCSPLEGCDGYPSAFTTHLPAHATVKHRLEVFTPLTPAAKNDAVKCNQREAEIAFYVCVVFADWNAAR